VSAADEKTGLRRGQNRCADFFRRNEKTFLTFVLFSDKIHLACGGIAQLGERLNGIQEVSGSIPLISTTKNPASVRTQDFFFFPVVLKPPGCQQNVSTNHLAGCCIAASGVLYALPAAARIFHGCRTTLRTVLFMGLTM
jgi:hypothetical protein